MKKWNLVIDVATCFSCNACAVACHDEYHGNSFPGYAAEMPKHGQRWIDIRQREKGKFPMVEVAYLPVTCNHCDDAPCMKAAKDGAITKRPDGIVIIDLLPHGALRLASVQLLTEPRERREDGVPAVSTAGDEAEVRHDIRVPGGARALLKNRAAGEGVPYERSESLGEGEGGEGGAAGEGTPSDRCESLGEGDGGEGGAAAEGPLVPINSVVNGSHSRQNKNVRDDFPPLV